ncbi:hypothetical protein SCRM01_218 [Synechococcus phage S-CRM01]|uniref:hypothetical protein n=1 Tax=Synechococcus phage S-CRM01 TaxID=1026955 RepID=UPI000209E42B|nr:hypothetical protein SCRM01_218 [Synechococcus phage S-CRM01]AEC53164.1 hypothetical protein SCRM01_218 [Synechococcus phage S-CRM01]
MSYETAGWKCFGAILNDELVAINQTYSGIKSDIYQLLLTEDSKYSKDLLDYKIVEHVVLTRKMFSELNPKLKFILDKKKIGIIINDYYK